MTLNVQDDTFAVGSGESVWAGVGAPIDLGDVRVSIWGQSNGIGRASRSEIAEAPLSSDSGLAAFDASTFERVYIWTGAAYALLTPASNNQCLGGDFGPEFGLAVRWMRETAAGRLYIDKNAFSGVSLTYFDPLGSSNGWTLGATERGQQDAWLSTNAVTIAARHLLWNHGEADYLQTQGWYQPLLQALVDAFDTAGYLDGASRLIFSDLSAASSQYGAGVSAAKAAVAAGDVRIAVVAEPPYLEVDDLHLDGRGQVQHAYDCLSALFDAPEILV